MCGPILRLPLRRVAALNSISTPATAEVGVSGELQVLSRFSELNVGPLDEFFDLPAERNDYFP